MRYRSFTIALLASLALGGCDLAPRYVRPAMPVPPSLPSGGTGDQGAAADVAWRSFFVDPKLQQLITLALANNRDLRIAVANVAQSRAQFGARKADQFPTVNGTGSATFQKESESEISALTGAPYNSAISRRSDSYQANLGISSWEIDLFGQLRNQTREAFETYLANQDARNAAQVLLISEVATDYLTLAADRQALAIAQVTAKSDLATLDLTRKLMQIGTASEIDVRQAQSSYDSTSADLARRTAVVEQDRDALQLVVGAPPPADLLPDALPDQGATLPQLPVGLSSEVLLRRPDIAEAEHKLRAANADIGAARAAFFPQISLTATLGSYSTALKGLFAGGNGTWNVAPQVSLPIFYFGKNAANLRYSKASRDLAVAQYEKAIQTAFKEVADALAQRATIGRQVAAQSSLADDAEVTLRLTELRYRTGVSQFLNVLDAQRTLYSAQQNLVTARLTEQSNMVELYRSLGGGLR